MFSYMRISLVLITIITYCCGFSQARLLNSAPAPDPMEETPVYESLADSLINEATVTDTVVYMDPLPRYLFMPSVFKTYHLLDTTSVFTPDYSGNPSMRWVEDATARENTIKRLQQQMFLYSPGSANYNISDLPEAPKNYEVTINPEDHTVTISEIVNDIKAPTIEAEAVKKKHWIKAFASSLQFSQAYVSPNWYQGGNNNINALLDLKYNVNLNQKFHPKWLFETTFQYKLGINSAPDDSLRNYNVSTDILQINSLLGYKAANRWYYSLTGQFKTQLVNAYKSNDMVMRSAFMSPAELTLGLGMTYNYTSNDKRMTLDVSIDPISYNLLICSNDEVDATSYGISAGKHTKSGYGSGYTAKMAWQITPTINFNSRLTGFTDYDRFYSDWENTLVFQLTRFLTTQLYVHMRYDTDTPPVPDEKDWKKFQIKEILSIGFSYNFNTI